MSGPVKTDAIVLRSLRYGEADRILHLYTPERGRIGAIAERGATHAQSLRRAPRAILARRLVCHGRRGELLTITAAETLDAHARLRDHAATLDSAARACDAVARVFETESHQSRRVQTCSPTSWRCSGSRRRRTATHANALAFRLKLLVSGGLAPYFRRLPRRAARPSTWSAIRPRPRCRLQRVRGRLVFRSLARSHEFMTVALGSPLAKTPHRHRQARCVSRARDRRTLEHHLAPAAGPRRCDDARPHRSRSGLRAREERELSGARDALLSGPRVAVEGRLPVCHAVSARPAPDSSTARRFAGSSTNAGVRRARGRRTIGLV